MKPVVIYYSRSGNTEKIANRISSDLKCEKIKIEPEEAYGNYVASVVRVIKEKGTDIPPAFMTPVPDLSAFDIIFLGFPIWAQDVPVFVADFISRCDLSRKTVIPFATYGMSDISWVLKKDTLKNACKDAEITDPFDQGVFKKNDYEAWMKRVKAKYGG